MRSGEVVADEQRSIGAPRGYMVGGGEPEVGELDPGVGVGDFP